MRFSFAMATALTFLQRLSGPDTINARSRRHFTNTLEAQRRDSCIGAISRSTRNRADVCTGAGAVCVMAERVVVCVRVKRNYWSKQ